VTKSNNIPNLVAFGEQAWPSGTAVALCLGGI